MKRVLGYTRFLPNTRPFRTEGVVGLNRWVGADATS
jgi:hypothetical protein